jgi:hypothetical protein
MYLKKLLLFFAVFSCFLMILTPMVNIVETKLVEYEIEKNINSNVVELLSISKFLYKLLDSFFLLRLIIKAYIINLFLGNFIGAFCNSFYLNILNNYNYSLFDLIGATILNYISMIFLNTVGFIVLQSWFGNFDTYTLFFLIPITITSIILIITGLEITKSNLILMIISYFIFWIMLCLAGVIY